MMTRNELFWRNLWVAVRRARKDKRALRLVLVVTGCVVYVAYLAATLFSIGFWGSLAECGLLALGFGVAMLIRRNNDRAGESLLKLSEPTPPPEIDLREHRKVLSEAMLRIAALVDRAGGEVLTGRGQVKEQHQGVCRRRTLDLAQQSFLWEGFTEKERGLLLSQEGSWAWDSVWPMVVRAEDVRALRWVLGMDDVLVPFEYLNPDLTPVVELTAKPELAGGEACLPVWELGPVLAMAQAMVNRCVIEGFKRGFLEEEDTNVREEYVRMAVEIGEDESGDLLIGARSVGKAETAKVQWVAQAALRRAYVLDGVIRYLNGPADGELRFGEEDLDGKEEVWT